MAQQNNEVDFDENAEEVDLSFSDSEVIDEDVAPAPLPENFARPLEIHADGGMGAFTGLLALSAAAYAAAAVLVIYEISEYAPPGIFPWSVPMP